MFISVALSVSRPAGNDDCMRHAVSLLPGEPMSEPTRCDRLIQIRAPDFLTKALDSAAHKRLTSRSDYIRTALLDRLRADGIAVDLAAKP
jgi:hypothetical protein